MVRRCAVILRPLRREEGLEHVERVVGDGACRADHAPRSHVDRERPAPAPRRPRGAAARRGHPYFSAAICATRAGDRRWTARGAFTIEARFVAVIDHPSSVQVASTISFTRSTTCCGSRKGSSSTSSSSGAVSDPREARRVQVDVGPAEVGLLST